MNIILNKQLTSFRDKEGPYVEVIAILPNKVILLYALEQTDTIDLQTHELNIGDLIYFDSIDNFKKISKKEVISVSPTSSNKQSPSRVPKDHTSRY